MPANCLPPYAYRPEFIASNVACQADVYEETRARCPVGLGGTFFRTKNTGEEQNLISIELIYDSVPEIWTLIVRNDGVEVEAFGGASPATVVGDQTPDMSGNCTPADLIPTLRSLVNGVSEYIEMPTDDYGAGYTQIFDHDDALIGDDKCLSPFPETFFFGGTGAPAGAPSTTGSPIETLPRTGPERTIYIVTRTEIVTNTPADDGRKYDTPLATKRQQWNGSAWIPYVPNSDCV